MPPIVHLIRHGETEWALTSRHTGRTDIPLTAKGEHESQLWATHLSSIPFDHVLTSPLQRARRTCELCGLSQTAQIEPDLAEWDYGDYEGQRSVDICIARPGWNLFRDGCPNGESPRQVTTRADRLIAHLRTLEGRIALFSHGQFGGRARRPLDRPHRHGGPALSPQHRLPQPPQQRPASPRGAHHPAMEHPTAR